MKYEAFISYRHGELDGIVAERLHRMLETYRIPKRIAAETGRTKIRRIFRDQEELPTSSDLSGSIDNALQESEFLILICSRRTCRSKWVMREVDRFIELGRRDRIITLLIDGEPDESFPEQIRWREEDGVRQEVEPLAADIRTQDIRKSLRLLKGEVLRIVAPILGCGYGDLRQRHRERVVRRMAQAGSGALAILAVFGAVSFYQLLQINEQMRWKLYNQSHVLAEYSTKALEGGDPITAALLALEALPRDLEHPERPYVEAAELALADAIGAYDYRETYLPHRSIECNADISAVALSPGEAYVAIITGGNRIRLFATETAEELHAFDALRTPGRGAVFPSDEVMVYTGPDALIAVNTVTGDELWRSYPSAGIAMSADGSSIAAVLLRGALLLDADGQQGRLLDFGERSPYQIDNPYDTETFNCVTLSDNGDQLAVAFTDGTVSVFETSSGEEVRLLAQAEEVACTFTDEYLLCTWWQWDGDRAAEGGYRIAAFRRDGWEKVWEEDNGDYGAFSCAVTEGRVFYADGPSLLEVDLQAGEFYLHASYQSNIRKIVARGGYVLAGCEDGAFFLYHIATGAVHPYTIDNNSTPFVNLALGERFAVASTDRLGSVRILGWNDRLPLATYPYHSDTPKRYGNKAGDRIISLGSEGFRIHDATTGELISAVSVEQPEGADSPIFWQPTEHIWVQAKGNTGIATQFYSSRDGALLYSTEHAFHSAASGISVQIGKEAVLIETETWQEVARYPKPSEEAMAWVSGDWLITSEENAERPVYTLRHLESGEVRVLDEYERFLGEMETESGLLTGFFRDGQLEVYSAEENHVLYRIAAGRWEDILRVIFIPELGALRITSRTEPTRFYSISSGELMDISYERGELEGVRQSEDGTRLVTHHYRVGRADSVGYLRDAETLEARAAVLYYEDMAGSDLLVWDPFSGTNKRIPVYSSQEIIAMGREFTAGHELTPWQKQQYHIEE